MNCQSTLIQLVQRTMLSQRDYLSAGLWSVEAPGQQCYRKIVGVMTQDHNQFNDCKSVCFNSKCQGMQLDVSTFASSKVSDEIYVFQF